MKIVLFRRQVILVPSFVNYKNATVACHITEFATMYKCTHIAAVKLENYGCSEILRKFTWCVLDKIERWQDIINPKRSKFFHFRADRFLEGGQPILKDLSSPEIVSSPLNSFDAKFQRTFVVCFFQQTIALKEVLYVKLKDWIPNSVDPDETAHYEPSHLDLCCLQTYYYCLWQWKS